MRWRMSISEFNFGFAYRLGLNFQNFDAFSRLLYPSKGGVCKQIHEYGPTFKSISVDLKQQMMKKGLT